jgi:hypothetical protein
MPATIDAMDNARAHVRTIYLGVMHREPESEAVLSGWANHLLQVGLDRGIADLVDKSTEPQSDLGQDFRRDHIQNPPGV